MSQPKHPVETRIIAGAMSGTSADGVDVAIVRVAGRGLGMSAELLRHVHRPYDASLRQSVFQTRHAGSAELAHLAKLGREIALTYAQTVKVTLKEASLQPADLAAVAAHGQTLFHQPPDTIQWLDPALLAAEVGCAVVSDFRRADCAAGGQGAPLVPFADYLLFRHPERTRVLLNIGGIANLTYLPAGAGPERVLAFDTGPGNCISDHLMREHDVRGPGYDAAGATAARGTANMEWVNRMLREPYFVQSPPKSTDAPDMIRLFLSAQTALGKALSLEDQLRSACLLTVFAIVRAFEAFDPAPDEVIVSGGGARNATMMSLLRENLAPMPLRMIEELGFPAEAKEAVAFALMGAATLDRVPSNLPSATGAKRPVVLGSITPAPSTRSAEATPRR